MVWPSATGWSRDIGPFTITGLVGAQVILWVAARPTDGFSASYVGQGLGAMSVLLLTIVLVLISTLTVVERWFDGVDRAAIWHRRVAILGVLLLVPHILLSSGGASSLGGTLGIIGASGLGVLALWAVLPRWRALLPARLEQAVVARRDTRGVREVRHLLGGYTRWRLLHRTTGLFVIAGFAHGVLDETVFAASPALRWAYLVTGAVGICFYIYRELIARYVQEHHDYEVETVRVVDDGVVEISLRPLGTGIQFVPGQFAMIFIEAKDGWHRHPFTLSSAPSEGRVRITMKALGDYTSQVHDLVQPGMPAVIGPPHGHFDRSRGTNRQIWIAGGIGVTPFLSWLRSLDRPLDQRVDLFYSTDHASPFGDEILHVAEANDSLRVHLIDTSVSGLLTTDQILAHVDEPPDTLSVFMCGPEPMLHAFHDGFKEAGVHGRHIHREYFDWR